MRIHPLVTFAAGWLVGVVVWPRVKGSIGTSKSS
jgi:hypothetical protein